MTTPSPQIPGSNDAIVRAVIAHPDALDLAYHETMVELMTDLAEGTLTGEIQVLAHRLRDTDEKARELYQLLVGLPPATALARRDVPTPTAFEELCEGLNRIFQEVYAAIAKPGLHAASESLVPDETIMVQGTPCILSRAKRPDGQFDVELVIPAGVAIDPADLDRLELRLVDRPPRLVFQRTASGELVARYVLPADVADPNKRIIVVSEPPSA